MLGDGRLGNGEVSGEVHHGALAPREPLDDPAAGRVGEGVKDMIEGGRIFYNHMVI